MLKAKNIDRRAGDAHRDAGEWALAAEAYHRHLSQRPNDVAIWVQLGHVQKEALRLDEAEAAYRRATAADPQAPDPLLHLAHLLKRRGKLDEAFQAFRHLLKLRPDADTFDNVQTLGAMRKRQGTIVAGGTAMLFVLQDYFSSFDAHATTTGIQRVQAGIIRAALTDPALEKFFLLNDGDDNGTPRFLALDPEALREILDYTGSDVVDQQVLRSMLLDARLMALPIAPGPGSLIVILGAFWGLGNGVERYLAACRQGARLAVYIYDLIPITHPEYCDVNLSNAFWRGLGELLHVVDIVLTISEHTRRELQRFIDNHGARQVPIISVPLAHSLSGRILSTALALPRTLAHLRNERRYAAYVSTIEGRKNHLYVVRAWQRLIEQGVAVPDLVFVGRKGWKIDELMTLLEQTRYLDGRVHIVYGLSDTEVDAVYSNALFTVFTSVVEGWGLPIGESLTHGVPCVGSRSASIPEVGGDFVDYIDITDLDDGVRVFRRLIEDQRYLTARRAQIRASFIPRTWAKVGADFISKLRAAVPDLPARHRIVPVSLVEGDPFHPSRMLGAAQPVEGYFARPLGLMLADSFYEADANCAWMRGEIGTLRFGVTFGAGERFVVLLALEAAPWAVGRRCSVEFIGDPVDQRRWMILAQGVNFIRLEGTLPADGICALAIIYEGSAECPPGDNRRFAIGLQSLGYCRLEQTSMRLELRDRIVFS